MKILILGGTGAMGAPLVDILSISEIHDIYVTSRQKLRDEKNTKYIFGDAKDLNFIHTIINNENTWDVIIDFMYYEPEEFSQRIDYILKSTKQYIFTSSSRVYADSNGILITENTKRLYDICPDIEYIQSNEYAIAKAKEEDILFNKKADNWTIIRPYITYNVNKLQLGPFQKEQWLSRALRGKDIVFPKDMINCKTQFSYGGDVARAISCLVGHEETFGEVYNIVSPEKTTWKEILIVYANTLESLIGKKMHIYEIESSELLYSICNSDQIRYDRLYNREFDCSKLQKILPKDFKWTSISDGIDICLSSLLMTSCGLKRSFDVRYEGLMDKLTKNKLDISSIRGTGWQDILRYMKYRLM